MVDGTSHERSEASLSLHPAQQDFHPCHILATVLSVALLQYTNATVVPKKRYWLTPKVVYQKLDAEFHFDFDPCPHPRPEGFDGLTCEWGKSNYVNPPFGRGFSKWISKALEESSKGKRVVLIYPLDKWLLTLLRATRADANVRNLGYVKFHSMEDGTLGGVHRPIAAFIF